MQVIVDLHGGDANNPVALAEFEEIKEKVDDEVSGWFLLPVQQNSYLYLIIT